MHLVIPSGGATVSVSLFFVSVGHEELVRDGGVGTRNEVTMDSLIGLSWTRAWKMKLQQPFPVQCEDFDKDFSHDGAVFVSIDPDPTENFSTLHFTMFEVRFPFC